MRIHVKLFAILRERAGTAEFDLELNEGESVADAREHIAAAHPSLRTLLESTAFAVNMHYVPATVELNDGDELALIPPVSGG